jgi:(1->4)-alpha-D-glucan 1-alpha-D-glucosylmutase
VLARRLDRISEQHRYSRDFTLNSQQEALAEVVACFPVYRSYVTGEGDQVSPEDRRLIQAALRLARRRNPAVSASLFDFLASVLLLEHPEGLAEVDREERRDFVRRLQQLAGPVMAKGLEDTASYRFYPLAALNEVGGEAEPRGDAVSRFHAQNGERLRLRPGSMTATSTHDTKRDEDTRARISVLSEIPAAWEAAVFRWHEMNRPFKTVEDEVEIPSPAEEHLLYQTLVGVWPPARDEADPTPGLVDRIQTYMQKALREAKANTSWVSPNEPYESAVAEFLARTLRPEHAFLSDFLTFLRPLVRPGLLNAAAQVVLKVAAPGVPDFFQGTELPEYRLVDPDNRGLVDFDRRARALRELQSEAASDAPGLPGRLLQGYDGRLKLYVTQAALRHRRRRPDLFLRGDYVGLGTRGAQGDDVVAFARVHEGAALIAAAGRFFTRRPWPPVGLAAWGDAALVPPPGSPARWRELLTGRLVVPADSRTTELPLADVFSHLPMALLESAP